MILQKILQIIELDRANLETAIEANRKLQEQEVNRRLKQRDEEWLGEIEKYCTGWWVETVPIEDLVSHMRQWAKKEGEE